MNIYLIGFMGSGKTTMGKQLATEMSYDFHDLDHYIEEKQGKSIPSIFEEYGEKGFRSIERDALFDSFKLKNTIVSTGGGAPCFFDNIEQINKNGLSIYLELTVHTLVKRLRNSPNPRPLVVGKSEKELSDFVFQKLKEREAFYSKAYFSIDNNLVTPQELSRIIKSLDIE